jgi:hypothetical protein
MADKNYFTDGTDIFRFERFDKVAVLRNLETNIIVRVPWPEDGRLDGFRKVELRQPAEKSEQREKVDKVLKTMLDTPPIKTDRGIPMSGRRKLQNKTSKYYGVSYHKKTRKWRVQVPVPGEARNIYGGSFDDEDEAGRKADELVQKRSVTGVKKNFP